MARLIVLLTLGSALSGAELFRFRSGFWLNLHHFLYVLGRSANGEADSKRAPVVNAPEDLGACEGLAPELKKAWSGAIEYYQRVVSKQDAVFDLGLISVTSALAAADASLEQAQIPGKLRAVLEWAAPAYRRRGNTGSGARKGCDGLRSRFNASQIR